MCYKKHILHFKSKFLKIGNKNYLSRLLIGSGIYNNFNNLFYVIKNSETNIVSVAIKKINLESKMFTTNLLNFLKNNKCTILPNTAGCYNARDAIFYSRLSRELIKGNNLIKLEILGDSKTLYPNMLETFKAIEILIKEKFEILVYCTDDPVLAKKLENMGVSAIMPLASMIGSGMGILNKYNLSLIIRQSSIPVIVDAGIGTSSDVVIAMELGCDGILMNSAIARAKNSFLMAKSMKLAISSGRESFLAGRMIKQRIALPSTLESNIN